jgi:hypothetical protein
VPHFIHERARHILAKNPEMPKSMAFALATQQSHALGKSPKGYGTAKGRRTAKSKYDEPETMETRANPGGLKTEKLADALAKFAFIESLPTLTGLAAGYGPGREAAGQIASEMAPEGRAAQTGSIARNAAVIGAPIGGLAAMALAKHYGLAPRLAKVVGEHFPRGLIAEPAVEQELVHLGVPGASAIGGSIIGGGLTGAAIGGLQRLRGALPSHEEKIAAGPSPMWSRIGGAASKKPVWMAQSGFTPTGFKTPAQRLSASMDMGKVEGSAGLKPLDIGKMQQAAQNAVKTAGIPQSWPDEDISYNFDPKKKELTEEYGGASPEVMVRAKELGLVPTQLPHGKYWTAQRPVPPGQLVEARNQVIGDLTRQKTQNRGFLGKPLFGPKRQAYTEADEGLAALGNMKMGMVLLAITKTATGQKVPIRNEKEDAETGDETEPGIAKAADDGGQGGFSPNQYSGVMNPRPMKYTSGIPAWQEPPVKTAGPPGEKRAGLADFIYGLSAPPKYVKAVSDASGIPEEHVKPYVYNIRPQRFMVTPEEFARDLKPIWDIKENKYNPLQQGLTATAEGSPEEAAYLKQHGKALDEHWNAWVQGQQALRSKYTGGSKEASALSELEGEGASSLNLGQYSKPVISVLDDLRPLLLKHRGKHQEEKTAAGISTPMGRLASSKAIGAPRVTAAPGPSIAQIAKPKGYGTPMSGAKKGNNII